MRRTNHGVPVLPRRPASGSTSGGESIVSLLDFSGGRGTLSHPIPRRMYAPSVRIVLPTTRVSVKLRSKGKSSTLKIIVHVSTRALEDSVILAYMLMAPKRSRSRAMMVLLAMVDPGAQKTTMAPCKSQTESIFGTQRVSNKSNLRPSRRRWCCPPAKPTSQHVNTEESQTTCTHNQRVFSSDAETVSPRSARGCEVKTRERRQRSETIERTERTFLTARTDQTVYHLGA